MSKDKSNGIRNLWGSLLYLVSIAASCALGWGVAQFLSKLMPGEDGLGLGLVSMFLIPFIFAFINFFMVPRVAGITKGSFATNWMVINIFSFIAFWVFAIFSFFEI